MTEKFHDCVDCHVMLSTRTTWFVKVGQIFLTKMTFAFDPIDEFMLDKK